MGKFDELLNTAYISKKFRAEYDAESYSYNKALSERQLFTQSNGRVLLGQDTMGRLHFIAAPHEKDYPLPTMIMDNQNHITACPGMYYQVDLTMFLEKQGMSFVWRMAAYCPMPAAAVLPHTLMTSCPIRKQNMKI